MGKPLRTPCPSWCAAHDDVGVAVHRSAHSRIPLKGGNAMAYAVLTDGGPPQPSVSVHGPSAYLQARDEYEAEELARLIEQLGEATPGQCRKLAAQVRAAAHVAFGPGEQEDGT